MAKTSKNKKKNLGSSPSSIMDPSIWSRIPEDILLQVLALLPLQVIVSLRSTSKFFCTLLSSPSFLSLLHRHTYAPRLLLSHPQFSPSLFLPSFSPSTSTWSTLPFPKTSSLRLLSSSSGLLCFSLHPKSPSLLLTNPLTCSTRTLLAPTTDPILSTTVLSHSSPCPHGYELLITTPCSKWVFLYDSQTESWIKIRGTHLTLMDTPGAFLGETVYYTTTEPFQVVGLDPRTGGEWRVVGSGGTPSLAFARVVSSGERLYFVGGVGGNGIARGVQVWEIIEGGEWVEVGRLPEMMWRKLATVCFHKYEHLHCVWLEETVCLGCVTWPEVLQWRARRDTWHWLPICPMLPKKWSCGFRWFSFGPDLYTIV